MNELVVDRVEPRLVLLVPRALRLPCGKALLVVEVGLERGHLRERIHAALERDLRRGDQLVVLGHKLVLLLHVLDDRGRERLFLHLGVYKQQIAVLRFKVLAERRREHRFEPRLLVFLDLRSDLVPERFLAVVKRVARVDRMTDVRQRAHGAHGLFQLFLFQEDRLCFRVALCVFELLGPLRKRLFHRIGIGPFVWHFGKFHMVLLSDITPHVRRMLNREMISHPRPVFNRKTEGY